MDNQLPLLITMGDPNGVGPEICVRALVECAPEYRRKFIIVGDLEVLKQAACMLKLDVKFIEANDLQTRPLAEDEILWNHLGVSFDGTIRPGEVDADAGAASIGWVREAVVALKEKRAAAMVTAPICKESIEKQIEGFQGHTEYIGEMCGDPQPVLGLLHQRWTVAHVSTHVSLREACDRVSVLRIKKTAHLLHDLCSKLYPDEEIKLGLAGLNPHAGENGLFGREEIEIINPASEELNREGISISKALPADVVFPMMRGGHFHGVVAMYHDQGHVVTKTLAFDLGENRKLNGVNITLGLPVIRTSVDHGTGFDLAWQGKAAPHSLLDAMDAAYKMSMN